MDRLTFQLERDASGEVDVHVHKTQVNLFSDNLICFAYLLMVNSRFMPNINANGIFDNDEQFVALENQK